MLNWKEQKKLAAKLELSPQYINDILCRRKPCPPKRAHRFGMAIWELFAIYIEPQEFVFNWLSEAEVFSALTYEQLQKRKEALYGPAPA